MEIQEFIGISIVGVALSGIVAVIKSKFGVSGNTTKLLTIALAIMVGGAYVWVRSTPYFSTLIVTLTSASTIYALLRK